MANIESLEDFQTWQKSKLLNNKIQEIIQAKKLDSNYNLRNQINSASLSIMANLAEGYGRQGNKEFYQFLSISKASATELKSHLYSAHSAKLISNNEKEEFFDLITDILKMSSGLMRHISKSDFKGAKYK